MSSKTEKMKQQAELLKQKIAQTEKAENEQAGKIMRKLHENNFAEFDLKKVRDELTKIFN